MVLDVYIKNMMSINIFFNFYFNGLNIFYKELEEYVMIFFWKFLMKNIDYFFFFIELIIIIIYILGNCVL